MATHVNLRDERIFPAFLRCPHESSINPEFFRRAGGFLFQPRRHWCLLAEITEVAYFIRLRLSVADKSGVVFPIAFHLDGGDEDLDLDSFREGHTIAILYARQHDFLDLTLGIRQEFRGGVKVGTKYRRLIYHADFLDYSAPLIIVVGIERQSSSADGYNRREEGLSCLREARRRATQVR
ncbi:MAG: hypothetical protein M1839_004005 [Geoglossum umbratile]|nr:MAG: hypothetical protein M1839_004005 [Geoglossum umbratile]